MLYIMYTIYKYYGRGILSLLVTANLMEIMINFNIWLKQSVVQIRTEKICFIKYSCEMEVEGFC